MCAKSLLTYLFLFTLLHIHIKEDASTPATTAQRIGSPSGLTPHINSLQRGIAQSFASMLSPRASSTLNNVTRNLFAKQAIQNGPASGQVPRDDAFHEAPLPPLPLPPLEPRGDALVIEPEPSIQVPNADAEAPAANRVVTFALGLSNSLVAAAPVAPMQGTPSHTSGTSSRQGTPSASTTGTSSLRRGGRERKKNKRYTSS